MRWSDRFTDPLIDVTAMDVMASVRGLCFVISIAQDSNATGDPKYIAASIRIRLSVGAALNPTLQVNNVKHQIWSSYILPLGVS